MKKIYGNLAISQAIEEFKPEFQRKVTEANG
jgi:hypothetical protein